MRIRIGYALELIGVLAVAMAISRWAYRIDNPLITTGFLVRGTGGTGFQLVGSFLFGVVMVGAIGLWIEAIRGKSPKPWGAGRRGWSLLALALVFLIVARLTMNLGFFWKSTSLLNTQVYFSIVMDQVIFTDFNLYPACVIASAWLTSWMAGTPRGPARDAREWASLAILTTIVCEQLVYLVVTTVWLW